MLSASRVASERWDQNRRDSATEQVIDKAGERGRNRTYNLVIKSHLLCQLSYAPCWDGT